MTVSLPFWGAAGPVWGPWEERGMAHGLSEPRTFWKNEKTVWGNLEKTFGQTDDVYIYIIICMFVFVYLLE